WFVLLIVPGLAYVAVLYGAVSLGHGHAFDLPLLVRTVQTQLTGLGRDPVTVVVVLLALLLAAAAVAAFVRSLAVVVERCWLLSLRGRPITRIGRRLRLLDERIQGEYHGLRADLLWPRAWLLLTDQQRLPVQTARTGIDDAAQSYCWGLLYLLLGVAWWPAAVFGAGFTVAAWISARRHTQAYAILVESVIDTNQSQIAAALGVKLPHGVITETEASEINARLSKGRPSS
ncbi:MAG TPA: hypothetical protein VEO01_07505, partial [Pseudonocardiaceae bacterium]|nr:hypothetical protein [Pseudonocardiaceae bacterium]